MCVNIINMTRVNMIKFDIKTWLASGECQVSDHISIKIDLRWALGRVNCDGSVAAAAWVAQHPHPCSSIPAAFCISSSTVSRWAVCICSSTLFIFYPFSLLFQHQFLFHVMKALHIFNLHKTPSLMYQYYIFMSTHWTHKNIKVVVHQKQEYY